MRTSSVLVCYFFLAEQLETDRVWIGDGQPGKHFTAMKTAFIIAMVARAVVCRVDVGRRW